MSLKDAPVPRWLRELERYLPVKTQFYLFGNIHDLISYPANPPGEELKWTYYHLRDCLFHFFGQHNYKLILFYDLVDGFQFRSAHDRDLFKRLSDPSSTKTTQPVSAKSDSDPKHSEQLVAACEPEKAMDAIRRLMANCEILSTVVIDFASRLLAEPSQLQEKERRLFLKLAKCAKESARLSADEMTFYNSVLLICDKLNDLPPWLYLNHPLVKTINIDMPNSVERRRYIDFCVNGFHNTAELADLKPTVEKLVDLTTGMGIREIESLRILSKYEKIPLAHPKEIIDRYKFGITDSAWNHITNEKLANAKDELRKWVKGQEAAIHSVLDIIKRAATGLSGIQFAGKGHRPKGILFFAGPTGVGKTELAKALARLLFGDDQACIRFDMSEYGQEHADQKLLGAPPGYVGYEEGGQLTNKIRESPFSVLLFDEIEKAHPKILDKFLQILDDGRMTDGKGETVYFSESIIIFTSNIGTYTKQRMPGSAESRIANILPYGWECSSCAAFYMQAQKPTVCSSCEGAEFAQKETPYPVIKDRMLSSIETHFKTELGRPELFNRFGNNFVVFDYIRPALMQQIIEKNLDSVARDLLESKKIEITFSEKTRQFLLDKAKSNMELGGRGIGNMIETVLVNPMARQLFEISNPNHAQIFVDEILEESNHEYAVFRLNMRHVPLS